MSEKQYSLKAQVPTLECTECGNNRHFTVVFNESMMVVEYDTGKRPRVEVWSDTGKDVEITCGDCGSKDMVIDDSFFEE